MTTLWVYCMPLFQVPIFLTKAIELYEMICVRHGLMVVGPTGGGKSKNIAVLKEALTHLKVHKGAYFVLCRNNRQGVSQTPAPREPIYQMFIICSSVMVASFVCFGFLIDPNTSRIIHHNKSRYVEPSPSTAHGSGFLATKPSAATYLLHGKP